MKSFDNLFAELENRLAEPVAGSGTTELLEAGVHSIGKKLVEEAAELWMAAEHESDQQVALEASQLIYYVQLMLVSRGISLSAIEEVL